jgi:isoquinoline 1-oxidoreductase subunit beta
MSSASTLSRRDFLKGLGAGSAALLLGFRMPGVLAEGVPFEPNAYIAIEPSGQVKLWIPWQEIGQGSLTAISMLLAEELEADWSRIDMHMAPTEPQFGRMSTGGSRSVRESWEPLRRAGASAREMLVSAAAERWAVDVSECKARQGEVHHKASARVLAYGELVAEASELELPESPTLKDPSTFRLIGHSLPRVDSPDKVDGKAIFGFDITHPGMLYAALSRSPFLNGTLAEFDDAETRSIAGVLEVVELEDEIAVLAEDSWSALRGRDALRTNWNRAVGSDFDSAKYRTELHELCTKSGVEARREGNPEESLAGAAKKLEAIYELPFLAHAPMETMNATATFGGEHLHVEVPTQGPSWCHWIASQAAELDPAQVSLRPMLAGGGFGRRLWPDYVDAPARLAKRLERPVKVIWSREDDFRHDYFRPASAHRLEAGLDASGKLIAWTHTLASPSISGALNPRAVENGLDEGVLSGAENLPYAVKNLRVDLHLPECALPVGWLRSVYDQNNAFANECFIDEIALLAGRDPMELRLELLADSRRLRGVVERVADMSGWGRETALARGISCHSCFGSSVAMVVEVDESRTRPRVHRVVVAVDCGPVVHPDGLRAQVEGGVAYALSAALREDVRVVDGEIRTLNFDEYPVLRISEMPRVEVHTVDSGSEIGGIGEPPVPPTAAALVNAWFAATGKRVRRLPMMV